MARSARRNDAQNLDSLLDTMANVVGILVVLVAVTQLTLGDAIERIREQAGSLAAATPDDLAEVVGERLSVDAAISDARSRLERFSGEASPGMMLRDAVPLLTEYESLAGASVAAGDQPSEAELRNVRVEVERLEGDVTRAEGQAAQLVAILAEPAVSTEPITIRLPDPRPVPTGLERVFFLCRGGEVHVIDLLALEQTLVEGVRAATGHKGMVTLEAGDIPWILNHFKKEPIGDQGYRWSFVVTARALFADLIPTDNVPPGDDLAALSRPGSRTAAALEALDSRRQYVRFFVWPDSYEAYLKARRLAETRGFRVGWKEMPEGVNLSFDVLNSQRHSNRLLD